MRGELNWRDPKLTARNIVEGWFHTGDLAYKDEDDFYWFVSRKSEIISHRAGLVSPIEVEGVLYQHPSESYDSRDLPDHH